MSGLIEPYGIKAGKAACFGTLVACGTGYLVIKYINYHRMCAKATTQKTKEAENIKKLLRDLKSWSVEQYEAILRLTPEEIIQATQQGKLKAVDICRAYLYKACLSTQEWNSVTCVISSAQDKASALAAADHPENKKLFGLPVSLKECMKTKGLDSTIGLVDLIGQPANEDCVLAKVLQHCGAIPFVKTNIPQLMLSFTSSNPIYGETSHPRRYGFAPGGSSAGEGSLVADGGSPLGFGTDIAGSIRVPSHLCGICGLKPTMNRLSKSGLQGSLPGQSLIHATLGPMAKNVSTLVTAMQALLCPVMFNSDPYVPPIPFNEEVFTSSKKLRIGFYVDDGYNKPIPAISRAVRIARQALKDAGHVLVPFQPPQVDEAMMLSTAALFADGGQLNLKRMCCNVEEPRLSNLYSKLRCPSPLRNIIAFILGLKWPRLGQDYFLHGGGDRSVDRLWKLEEQAGLYRKKFYNAWTEAGLDAVICPPFPIVSGPYKHFENLTALMSYTILYNFVDYPAGVVPVTKVSQSDSDELRNWRGHYGDPWDSNIQEACKDSVGMPVGVQCVAKPWQDETCLRVMKDLESRVARV